MRPPIRALIRQRPFRLYLAGHGLILLGAASIEPTSSLLPMALASSAGLLLSMPLLRQLLQGLRRRP